MAQWIQLGDDRKSCQFASGFNSVMYLTVHTMIGAIEFAPLEGNPTEPLVVEFRVFAENMVSRFSRFEAAPNAARSDAGS